MKKLGPINALYPMLTTLVGTNVKGKANFLAVAHLGILNHGTPQYLSISLGKIHYSNAGIKENKTFSICLPSEKLMLQTDYCGIMSGKNTDKAALFDVFYGELETAPMIRQCPVNMELRLHKVMDFSAHDLMVGELVQTYAEDNVLSEGKVDIAKLRPLLFDMASKKYWSLGKAIGNCWNDGKVLKEQ